MKVSKFAKRALALAVCLVMLTALAAPALALTMFPHTVTTATPVYSSNNTASAQIGSFNVNDTVGVTGKDSASAFYQVYDQATSKYGWIPMTTVSNNATSSTITAMRAVNGSIAVTPVAGSTTSTTGTAGYVTNCSSWVYYRSSASTASSARAGKISKNAVVSILGTSGSFTKCLYNGQTVYIDSRYVTSGTPSSSSGSTSTANGSATITNCSSWVSMRKSASSKSTRLYKLNKGTAVTVLGTSGEYTKISYKSKTGYVLSTYVGGSTGGSTTANTGASSKAGTGGVRIARNSSVTRNAVLNTMNQFKAKNSDVVGMMNILDGQITEPILYDASGSFFYNDHDVNKASNSTGAIYSLYNGLPRNNVISGHNMRQSGTMFHRLHHLQERALGYNMCQAVNAGTNHSIGDVPD
ncbi:MAG: SH3 domain-containing protein, partial [Eubacteriales bacterium]|nr:SH3 domain-containing protein [Eubacteriales bacterium]